MGITYYYMDHNVKEPFTSNPLYEQVYTLRNNIYICTTTGYPNMEQLCGFAI